jgi:hypothetical protein
VCYAILTVVVLCSAATPPPFSSVLADSRVHIHENPEPKAVLKPFADLQKTATGAVAAAAIASSVLAWAPPPADASTFAFGSQVVIAAKVVREGVYGEYEVDITEQKYDDARSTFKSAKETKTKKGTCAACGTLDDVSVCVGIVVARAS